MKNVLSDIRMYFYLICLIFFNYVNCFHMNVGSTGVLFSYTLGALAYIKHQIKPNNYTLTGISGGAWCSVLYHLEPNIEDHDVLWNILVGDRRKTLYLLKRSSMQSFQEAVALTFIDRYKNVNVQNIPISIVTTKVTNRLAFQSVKIDNFTDIHDLVNYCLCSSYIPLISGNSLTKMYKNERYIDGEIRRDRECFNNCINSKAWGRKYPMKQRLFLDFSTSRMLFNDGWNDASSYFKK